MIKRSMVAVLPWLVYTPNALALGECGLSCCIGNSAVSGVTLAQNFGVSVQYEYSDMETIRHGSDAISPDEVIDRHWQRGGFYSVPTKMKMQKLTFTGAYPINERMQLLGIAPFVKNDMDMRAKNAMGMTMDHTMDTISGLGDISLMGLYVAYTDAPVRPTERFTVGVGLKTPTGKDDEKTAKGNYVHAMMQAGSGSWDGLFMANYMRAYYPLILQANLFYHLTTENGNGYEFGDQFAYDLIMRYQVADYINLGLELNGIHAGKDTDHEGKYSRPAMSMPDNPEYTGLDSLFLSPGVQYKIPNTGGSIDFKYQIPVHQNVNGYQQVVDGRALLSLTWNF